MLDHGQEIGVIITGAARRSGGQNLASIDAGDPFRPLQAGLDGAIAAN